MRLLKPYYCLPVLGALAMSSCVLPAIQFPIALPIVSAGYGNGYPRNNGAYYYYHQGRYYNGGRYENGNYYYRGQNYNGRYYQGGRYYYGGRQEYHDRSWQPRNRGYSY